MERCRRLSERFWFERSRSSRSRWRRWSSRFSPPGGGHLLLLLLALASPACAHRGCPPRLAVFFWPRIRARLALLERLGRFSRARSLLHLLGRDVAFSSFWASFSISCLAFSRSPRRAPCELLGERRLLQLLARLLEVGEASWVIFSLEPLVYWSLA